MPGRPIWHTADMPRTAGSNQYARKKRGAAAPAGPAITTSLVARASSARRSVPVRTLVRSARWARDHVFKRAAAWVAALSKAHSASWSRAEQDRSAAPVPSRPPAAAAARWLLHPIGETARHHGSSTGAGPQP
jgi:hypothetical protein